MSRYLVCPLPVRSAPRRLSAFVQPGIARVARAGLALCALALQPLQPALSVLTPLSVLAPLAVVEGCASTPAPANAQLQGRWRLDRAAGDDGTALIASAVSAAEKQWQRRARRFHGGAGALAGPSPGGSGDGGDGGDAGGDEAGADVADLGTGTLIGPDFPRLRQRLQQMLAAPRTLTFTVQPDEVQVERDGLPGRDYQPGESLTRFDEYGTARLKAAWKDQAFVLTERYTSGARLEERYALDAHGALLYTRSLRDPTVGRIEIRSTYRRAG